MPEMVEAPKYSVCFSDLAEYLNLKDEVLDKVAQYDEEDESVISLQQASHHQAVDRSSNIAEQPIAEAAPQQEAHMSSNEEIVERPSPISEK